MKRVLTYGTFDLLHYGHIRLLKRAKTRDYSCRLSTDEFNEISIKNPIIIMKQGNNA
jgi:glycerol-3-phosphate cytidylyltransferase-like family protein